MSENKLKKVSDDGLVYSAGRIHGSDSAPSAQAELMRRLKGSIKDLEKAIEKFNKQSSKQTDEVIKLTKAIVVLTIAMLIGLVVQIGLIIKQTNYTEVQSRSDRIFQAQETQKAIEFCKENPKSENSGLNYISSGEPTPCFEVLKQYGE